MFYGEIIMCFLLTAAQGYYKYIKHCANLIYFQTYTATMAAGRSSSTSDYLSSLLQPPSSSRTSRPSSTSDFLTSLLPSASSRNSQPSPTCDLLSSLVSAGSALVGRQGQQGSPLLQGAGQLYPLLQGAGQLVVDNWEPIVQVHFVFDVKGEGGEMRIQSTLSI